MNLHSCLSNTHQLMLRWLKQWKESKEHSFMFLRNQQIYPYIRGLRGWVSDSISRGL